MADSLWWTTFLLLIFTFLAVRPIYCICGNRQGIEYHTADKYGTPNFFYSPQSEQNNQYCEWQIKSTELGRVISVHFTIIHREEPPSCLMHNISIYDGPNINSTRLGVICNDEQTLSYESSSIYMYIVFQTTQTNDYNGFICKYVSKSTPKPTSTGGGTMGATMGSIAAGSLVIGAICCCCFKKGMKGRAIKPSTTFRFGNRGLFSSTTTTSISPSARQSHNPRTAVLAASIHHSQGVYNVRGSNVTFHSPPVPDANPPPTYTSCCPRDDTAPPGVQPPAYSSLSTVSPEHSEPPRYSAISSSIIPTISETQKDNPGSLSQPPASVDNGEVKLQLRPRHKDSSDREKEEIWSPPPPYEYHT